MNRSRFLILTILVVVALSFVGLLVYVSILGVNNKIDDAVVSFMENLKKQNYAQSYGILSAEAGSSKFQDKIEYSKFCFTLEMALLRRYDLLEAGHYVVDTKRSHYWIPFMGRDNVRVSLRLREKQKGVLQDLLTGDSKSEFVPSMFTVVRRNGLWKINDIRTDAKGFQDVFQETREYLNLAAYFTATDKGFSLTALDVDVQELSPLERYRLEFVLDRARQLINRPQSSGK